MKEYIKVNGTEYPATTLYINKDRNWGDREVRRVYLNMPYAEAAALLPSGTSTERTVRSISASVPEKLQAVQLCCNTCHMSW